jgi:redox-sensitive bicupin YhaK (pirin superfamily)
MGSTRGIRKIISSKPTVEGAGVHLKRAFGFDEVPQLDPFLLLDDFHSDNPPDYIKGFPWHPHRGIETITYVLYGRVEHGDSGSGVIHQEMPKGQEDGLMWGFQLWANLPASHKMMDPRYQDVKGHQIPEVTLDKGVKAKIICGEVGGVKGPVEDIVIDPEYLDITIPSKCNFTYPVKKGYTVFAYVIEGEGYFDADRDSNVIGSENLIIFDDGDEVSVTTEEKTLRFILVSGKPIGEPVAWQGPMVMNTQEELRIAFEEYQNGTFIKHAK